MKIYKETQKVIKSFDVVTVKCDLCGSSQDNWKNSTYSVVESDVRLLTGRMYIDGGEGTEASVDICPDCFKSKLIPWLKSQGAEPTTKKIEWSLDSALSRKVEKITGVQFKSDEGYPKVGDVWEIIREREDSTNPPASFVCYKVFDGEFHFRIHSDPAGELHPNYTFVLDEDQWEEFSARNKQIYI